MCEFPDALIYMITSPMPHWLDEVFENVRDSDEMVHVLLGAPEMKEIATKSFEAGERQRRRFDENPKLVGPTPAQVIRQEFLRRTNAHKKEEALADSLTS